MDQRRSPRYLVRFDALIWSESRKGTGVLSDISYGGARLSEVSIPAAAQLQGQALRLRLARCAVRDRGLRGPRD